MTKLVDVESYLELVRAGRTNAEIAAQLGVTVRTLARRRAADPELNQAILQARAALAAERAVPEHGTAARYRRGCRCEECRAENTRRHYEGVLRRRERDGLPPPDPDRGRRRASAQTSRAGRLVNVDRQTLIEQAIACGEPTSSIMQRFGCDYAAVKTIRDALEGC